MHRFEGPLEILNLNVWQRLCAVRGIRLVTLPEPHSLGRTLSFLSTASNDVAPAATSPAQTTASDSKAMSWAVVAALSTLVVGLGAVHMWWLLRFREGFGVDSDEAGYLSFAFLLHDALHADGPLGVWRGFQGQGGIGPLLPSVTALVEVFGGARQIIPSIDVQIVFFAVLVFASYGIGRRLLDRRAGVLTAVVVATVPAVTDYVRTYQLVIPSTAMYAVATYALLASDQPSPTWMDDCLGPRARPDASLPNDGDRVPPGTAPRRRLDADRRRCRPAPNRQFHARPRRSHRRCAAVVRVQLALDLGLPRQLRLRRSEPWARHQALAALARLLDQRVIGTIDLSLYLPLASVLGCAFLLAAASRLTSVSRGSGALDAIGRWVRGAARSDAIVPAFVVVEGYLALTSSSNDGTGFVVPLLPAFVALAVVAGLRVRWRIARSLLVAALLATSAFDVVMKAAVVRVASETRRVELPILGPATLMNGRDSSTSI